MLSFSDFGAYKDNASFTQESNLQQIQRVYQPESRKQTLFRCT
jgi:hypothetical protein